jgi:hypothetical protein
MATREPLAPKADQPRVTTKELARTEKRDGSVGGRTGGPTLQYKNVDVKLTPNRSPRKTSRDKTRA